ncbi:type I restriction endonuclease subunit R [Bilophila wadsworthia]|uniref:type I restriction endonuclease subunit R n=1 Tax=Bilophila wadsworthia TaxID=35833 RepID=UPI00242BFFDE|nr:type I restriction endonuclease subunit R [Bilophila wadsworthia]
MPTNIKESGLESLIVSHLVNAGGYEMGDNADYDRTHAVDVSRLFRFLKSTQPDEFAKIGAESELGRQKFLDRVQGEVAKRGIVDVLRKGLQAYPAKFDLFYQTPSEKNETAKERFDKNVFSVTRQLQFSADQTRLALDMCLFINGLPVITFELKNSFTKQSVDDAVRQYQNDRDQRELLFQFKRCMVHFAVDDVRVKFCTRLNGNGSWFLPFDKGHNDGAGNPVNPHGLKTAYLWEDILRKRSLADIIENYAQVIAEVDENTKKTSYKQIFPRFHQLMVVRSLLADVQNKGVGHKYLIQHSAGSGKSNSIAWLAHQLVGLQKDGKAVVNSVIVVTDRVNLDKQIRDTIMQFMQVSNTVQWAEHSGDLRKAIAGGKKIIITTVHKFPYILDEIGNEHKCSSFAVIIDEAHSSQSGSLSAKMNIALSGEYAANADMSMEDMVNQLVETRKMLTNASYFAFTATPKNKTLEMFGVPYAEDGETKHRPFHVYSMKQAIQEGFIMDVLQNYTTIKSYYKLAKTITDDPLFDKKKAQKKLRYFVESNSVAINRKAEIMVEHFHAQVTGKGKIGGKARAMVVTSSIDRALEYYTAINGQLQARQSPYKAIVAFSGEREYRGNPKATEDTINGFPGSRIEKEFRKDEYRFLVVADKFQTGYDEPLLHTMYVDKVLTDIKAVQTLSRLNRAHPQKHDTCVLDFANDTDTIVEAFSRYYRTTILSAETDPNQLSDLIHALEQHQVYAEYHVDTVVDLFLHGAERDRLDPYIDQCAENYKALSLDDQIAVKSAAKSFVRLYGFLGAILPYGNAEWEKLSIFLTLLIPKLPSPKDDDLADGILNAIDLDSYRAEARTAIDMQPEEENAEVAPVPSGTAGGKPEAELDHLTQILNTFNDLFGGIEWKDEDNVRRQIRELPAMVAKDEKYRNALKNSDKQNARMESDNALKNAVFSIMQDNMEIFKQFNDNPSFRKWLSDLVFDVTYAGSDRPAA